MTSDSPAIDEFRGLSKASAQRYRLEEILGRGGMGVVVRALDRELNRPVAIKLLTKRTLTLEERARFDREAGALALLSHPGVVRLFDARLAEDPPFLVMECLGGNTLAERYSGAPAEPRTVQAHLTEILDALDNVHSHGVLHRDLKPQNVFCEADDRIVIVDFGLARETYSLTRLTSLGQVVGTLRYLSPERLLGDRATVQSDLYAVGQIGLFLLRGYDLHPESGPDASWESISRSLSSGTYIHRAQRMLTQDGALGRALLQALDPDPVQRFESAVRMREAIGRTGMEVRSKGTRRVSLADAPTEEITCAPRFEARPRRRRLSKRILAGCLAASLAVVGLLARAIIGNAPVGAGLTPPIAAASAVAPQVTDALLQDSGRPASIETIQRAFLEVMAGSEPVPFGARQPLSPQAEVAYVNLIRESLGPLKSSVDKDMMDAETHWKDLRKRQSLTAIMGVALHNRQYFQDLEKTRGAGSLAHVRALARTAAKRIRDLGVVAMRRRLTLSSDNEVWSATMNLVPIVSAINPDGMDDLARIAARWESLDPGTWLVPMVRSLIARYAGDKVRRLVFVEEAMDKLDARDRLRVLDLADAVSWSLFCGEVTDAYWARVPTAYELQKLQSRLLGPLAAHANDPKVAKNIASVRDSLLRLETARNNIESNVIDPAGVFARDSSTVRFTKEYRESLGRAREKNR